MGSLASTFLIIKTETALTLGPRWSELLLLAPESILSDSYYSHEN